MSSSSSGKNRRKGKPQRPNKPSRKQPSPERPTRSLLILAGIVFAIVIVVAIDAFYFSGTHSTTTTTTTFNTAGKPVILYVNQGNGFVGVTKFIDLTTFAKSHAFNTIFFQIYRNGTLLFANSNLTFFVTSAHFSGLQIYFALYFTDGSQKIPTTIYGDGEDGINLDMSTLPDSAQSNLLSILKQNYHNGKTAITTFNFTTDLKPDLLVLETYSGSAQKYIKQGIIAGVEVVATLSKADYLNQLNYALEKSDGVMVFDYSALQTQGY